MDIQKILDEVVKESLQFMDGDVARYIPELAAVDADYCAAALHAFDNINCVAGANPDMSFTLQSTAKLVVFIGLLEEKGPDDILKFVKFEPSGDNFASVARLDQFGPIPSNPMLNSGAISLCGQLVGEREQQIHWLEGWVEKLFGEKLKINPKVFASEQRTGDRNRALAYLLKSTGVIKKDVDDVLDAYFSLCSFEATVKQAVYLPSLLARGGKDQTGKQVISKETAAMTVSLMATCGLYNESGTHLIYTGMPAKSGVSGYILALVPNVSAIAVLSPRVNHLGTSVRGAYILRELSKRLKWNFAIK